MAFLKTSNKFNNKFEVQILKKDPQKGSILQFGTELVFSKDKSIVALLGASPGASIAVKIALDTLNKSFNKNILQEKWLSTLKKMIPSYGKKLAENPEIYKTIRKRTQEFLQLTY